MTLFLAFLVIDRLTKVWAMQHLVHAKTITPFLNLTLVWNRGVGWGLFSRTSQGAHLMLSLFIAAVIVFFLVYTVMQYRKHVSIVCELLVLSGACSNLFDRLYYGAVIDFIELHGGGFFWPTFNIADSFIVIGIGGILIKGLLWEQ